MQISTKIPTKSLSSLTHILLQFIFGHTSWKSNVEVFFFSWESPLHVPKFLFLPKPVPPTEFFPKKFCKKFYLISPDFDYFFKTQKLHQKALFSTFPHLTPCLMQVLPPHLTLFPMRPENPSRSKFCRKP